MGFLGGRAARVLVRKKRSRGRGGSGRDFRVDDNDYKAHNLSEGGGRSRGGSRRRPPKGSSGGRDDNRQASPDQNRNQNREPNREEKSGSRRGSRGRGGRGRSQETTGRGSNQSQRQGQRQGQRQDQPQGQRQDQRQGQRQDQRQGQRQGQRQDQNQQQAKPNGRGSRNRRGMPRNNRGGEGVGDSRQDIQVQATGNQAPKEQSRPVRNKREDSGPRDETPIRPLRQEPVNTPEIQNVQETPAVRVEPKPIEKKEETTVSKPNKPRRGFGGLGSRLKERRAEAKAAETKATEAKATEAKAAPPAQAESPAASVESSAPSSPAPERTERQRRSPSYGSGHAGEEVILSGIKGVKYAKPIGSVTDEDLDDALTELTDGMLARAGFPCRCETLPGEYRQIKVTTDDASAGMLIGRHGQAIDAVEHLVERMASNSIDARARINLDINNYRTRREESLAERVAEASATIQETGRAFHMEPMSARERRLVHMEAAELGGLRTFTMDGSGGKHVVIAVEEEPRDESPVDPKDDDAEELNNSDI